MLEKTMLRYDWYVTRISIISLETSFDHVV